MPEWRRKHDPPRGSAHVPDGALDRLERPECLKDVLQAVADAERAGKCVRPCGSGWSLSAAVCEPGFDGRIIDIRRLNRTLRHVIPKCLRPGLADTLYHVEAGIALHDLYSRLDHQDPRWPFDGRRWALPTLPSAGGQTLAGAISTGTHGADIHLAPLGDSVQALHLVGAGGHQFWVERARYSEEHPTPMCEPERLLAVLDPFGERGVTVIQEDDAFDSLLVALGRIGILYSAVLRVVPAFALEETRVRRPWSVVRRQLADRDGPLFAQRSLQVVLNPLERGPDRSCWVTQRREIPLPEPVPTAWRGRRSRGVPGEVGRNPPIDVRPGSLRCRICGAQSVALLSAQAAGVVGAVGLAALAARLPARATLSWTALALPFAAVAACYRGSLGDAYAATWNAAARRGWTALLERLAERMIATIVIERPARDPLRDVSYAIMDRHDYSDRCCVTDGDALDVSFDADADGWLRFIEDSLLARSQALLRTGRAGASYAELRFTGCTRAHLGMQQWPRTCSVAIAGMASFAGAADLLDALESDAVRLGAAVHWGQRNQISRAQVEATYPKLDAWRATLRRLSAHGDPGTFSSAYTRQAGLEP